MSNRRPEKTIPTMLVVLAGATLLFLATAGKLSPSYVLGTVAVATLLVISTQKIRF